MHERRAESTLQGPISWNVFSLLVLTQPPASLRVSSVAAAQDLPPRPMTNVVSGSISELSVFILVFLAV